MAGEQPCRKGPGGAGWQQAPQEPSLCPGSPEGKLHSGARQTQHNQPVRRGNCLTVFSVGAASAWELCAVLGPTIWEGCEGLWMRPEKVKKAGERAVRYVLWGAPEGFRLVWFGEKRLREHLIALYSFLRRGSGEGGAELFLFYLFSRSVTATHTQKVFLFPSYFTVFWDIVFDYQTAGWFGVFFFVWFWVLLYIWQRHLQMHLPQTMLQNTSSTSVQWNWRKNLLLQFTLLQGRLKTKNLFHLGNQIGSISSQMHFPLSSQKDETKG